MISQVAPADVAQQLSASDGACLLDVREKWEWDVVHIEGALHMPMGEIAQRMQSLPEDVPLYVLCHHGVRSNAVAQYLTRFGFSQVYNVRGGIDAWAIEVDRSLAKY